MILVLSSDDSQGTGTGVSDSLTDNQQIKFRSATSNEAVLDWVSAESFERIIVMVPFEGINPFALSRSLKRVRGPKLVLAGQMRPFQRFWAERCGCQTAQSLQAALET